MLQERIEAKWIRMFMDVLALNGVGAGTRVGILSETQSRLVNVELARLAAGLMDAEVAEIRIPTPALPTAIPMRSTGASEILDKAGAAIAAMRQCEFILDLSVEGLMHAPQLPQILESGARVLYVSNEHPEVLERLKPAAEDEAPVRAAMRALKDASEMTVRSAAGTDLRIDLRGAGVGGVWGFTRKPGTMSHWPGGLVLAFPAAGAVNGRLVLAPGDVNLTFKRYVQLPVALAIAGDYITGIEGDGVDANLMRNYLAAWGEREAYAVSHVGWGLARAARWEALEFYDRKDTNGTELRAIAGNFLYSTGANERAQRYTRGHFDLPMQGCTIALDGRTVVKEGELAPG
ncbi:MAG: peptidase M29 [Noviherbaspirillum sp.]